MKIRGIRMKTLLLNNAEVGQLIDLDEIYEAVKEGYEMCIRDRFCL